MAIVMAPGHDLIAIKYLKVLTCSQTPKALWTTRAVIAVITWIRLGENAAIVASLSCQGRKLKVNITDIGTL